MLTRLLRRRWALPAVAGAVLLTTVVGTLVATSGTEGALVIYNGRSHYGDETVFRDFEKATGIQIELRGGTAPELFERLRREGEDTPADLLVTTDLANLWRAKEAGLLQPARSSTLEARIPAALHDGDEQWWAISTRLRIPVVSTERVAKGAVDSYADLGDPRFRGRTCLRTSNSEYNQSLVADMLAKRGRAATETLLRSWMANNPEIINSDGEMLAAIAAGDCDLGLANHYYLGRILEDDPDFPVAPAWPDQDAAGAHANVSGVGLVRWSNHRDDAIAFMEYLTSPKAQREITKGSEFAANPDVAPPAHLEAWAGVKVDPIDVDRAGPLLREAISLMLAVGWR
jgi:iron(III) transport system substrate-binding protein